ncbi:transcription termination/antitermination protein NusG [Candidatus Dependentiae bacterium]|nr:transcription termination/antitermination protein NusG [Candidatus Dependentiae bacterium]
MKKWYVVQVFAGYEDLVKTDLTKRIQEEGMQEYFGDILIPSAKIKQFFESDQQGDQQLFPGYMLIQMEAVQQAIRLVTKTPKVLRFLGGTQPVALSQKEIDRVLGQVKGEVALPTVKHEFEIGKEVDIKEGPFSGFVGLIDKIDEDSEKLTVMVSIFGRLTPVELNFDQIKR